MRGAAAIFWAGLLAVHAAAGEREPSGCPCCRLPFAEGTLFCWGCGTRVPGSPEPSKVAAVEIAPVRVLSGGTRGLQEDLAALSPEVALAGIERWIAENPNDFAGALRKLKDLLGSVRGTSLEAVVDGRIKEISAAAARASAPKSPQERAAEAARAYTKVMEQVRREPDRILNNIKLLEELLKSVEGTPYEQLVRQQIERERAKASR